MKLTVDLRELDQLAITLRDARSIYPKSVVSAALKEAAKPMLVAAKQEAPVGNRRRYASNSNTSGSMDRGGATRRDIRLKAVTFKGGSVGVLVGVSKKRGRVGWRTQFITRGTKFMRRNDFLERAFNRTFDLVRGRLENSLGQKFEAYIRRRAA